VKEGGKGRQGAHTLNAPDSRSSCSGDELQGSEYRPRQRRRRYDQLDQAGVQSRSVQGGQRPGRHVVSSRTIHALGLPTARA